MDVKGVFFGVDVVFWDLIEWDENLSVIISEIFSDKILMDLGIVIDVGYCFMKIVNDVF